jgi:hypothetical protein
MLAHRHGKVIGMGSCVRVKGEGGYFVYSTGIKYLTYISHVLGLWNGNLVLKDGVVDEAHIVGVG